jgi:DNA-binding Xre family transcriptional regulator
MDGDHIHEFDIFESELFGGKTKTLIMPIAAYDAMPNDLRESLRLGHDVMFPENRRYAFVAWHAYERIRDDIEDAIDGLAFDRAKAAHNRDRSAAVPLEVVKLIDEGVTPLAAWRKHRGMRQAELAEASGVERSYVAHLEGGKRQGTPETLARLAKVLGCTVDDLIES